MTNSIRRQQRPFTRVARERLQRLRQMIAVVQQEDTPRSFCHEKGEQRGVCFCGIAGATCQDQVVRSVVCRHAASRTHVIERDGFRWHPRPTIGAHGPVTFEEPLTMRTVGASGGTTKAGTAGGTVTGTAGVFCRCCGGLATATSGSCHPNPSENQFERSATITLRLENGKRGGSVPSTAR